MNIPRTIADLHRYIENAIPESINLDYKDSRALNGKPGEIAKDVSAFANADGGIIIYGIKEEHHRPIELDAGVDHLTKTREWLETVILTNITPTLDNFEVIQVELSDSNSAYVVSIPKSVRAPHQERQNKRYYKRYNFCSVPLEDYEIRDIMNRRLVFPPLLSVGIDIDQGYIFEIFVENISTTSAVDIVFELPPDLVWQGGTAPQQLIDGLKILQPKERLSFFYCGTTEAFTNDCKFLKHFCIKASYYNSEAGQRVSDEYWIDIDNYLGTSIRHSEMYYVKKEINDGLSKVVKELASIKSHLENIANIAAPTGLRFSVSTIRDLSETFGLNPKTTKFLAHRCSYNELMEILEIDLKLAHRLYMLFTHRQGNSLDEVEGITDEIIFKIRQNLILSKELEESALESGII